MSEPELYQRYTVTIGCCHGPRRRREWISFAEEISEDDAIWTAFREFRREEVAA